MGEIRRKKWGVVVMGEMPGEGKVKERRRRTASNARRVMGTGDVNCDNTKGKIIVTYGIGERLVKKSKKGEETRWQR